MAGSFTGSAIRAASGTLTAAQVAARRQQETWAATAALDRDPGRLLFVGLFDGTIPVEVPFFEALVDAVALVMWHQDCNVIGPPAADAPHPDHRAAHAIAARWRPGPASGSSASFRRASRWTRRACRWRA